MKEMNQRRSAGWIALRACALVVVTAASVIVMAASAESATLPVQPAKSYASPYTRAAMAQHARAANLSTGRAPTAMQAAGKPARAHAAAKR